MFTAGGVVSWLAGGCRVAWLSDWWVAGLGWSDCGLGTVGGGAHRRWLAVESLVWAGLAVDRRCVAV